MGWGAVGVAEGQLCPCRVFLEPRPSETFDLQPGVLSLPSRHYTLPWYSSALPKGAAGSQSPVPQTHVCRTWSRWALDA